AAERDSGGVRSRTSGGKRIHAAAGGMNLWVRLARPLDAEALLPRAQELGAAYLPGRYFAVAQADSGGLRLSFAGLTPEEIRKGLAVLGRVFGEELEKAGRSSEAAPALV